MNAVGIWFYSLDTERYLYLLRNDPRNPVTWGLPGGKVESGESLLEAIKRECQEEVGCFPEYVKLIPVEKFTSNDGVFVYHTFFCCILSEFKPTLNHEHQGYAWIDSGTYPRPLHPGLYNTMNFEEVKNKIRAIKESLKID